MTATDHDRFREIDKAAKATARSRRAGSITPGWSITVLTEIGPVWFRVTEVRHSTLPDGRPLITISARAHHGIPGGRDGLIEAHPAETVSALSPAAARRAGLT